jgi:hypothetical protein
VAAAKPNYFTFVAQASSKARKAKIRILVTYRVNHWSNDARQFPFFSASRAFGSGKAVVVRLCHFGRALRYVLFDLIHVLFTPKIAEVVALDLTFWNYLAFQVVSKDKK